MANQRSYPHREPGTRPSRRGLLQVHSKTPRTLQRGASNDNVNRKNPQLPRSQSASACRKSEKQKFKKHSNRPKSVFDRVRLPTRPIENTRGTIAFRMFTRNLATSTLVFSNRIAILTTTQNANSPKKMVRCSRLSIRTAVFIGRIIAQVIVIRCRGLLPAFDVRTSILCRYVD